MLRSERSKQRRGSQHASAEDHAALEQRVAELAATVDRLVVQQARTQEELTLLRHEQVAARGRAR